MYKRRSESSWRWRPVLGSISRSRDFTGLGDARLGCEREKIKLVISKGLLHIHTSL